MGGLHAEGFLGSPLETYTHKGVRKDGQSQRRTSDALAAEDSAYFMGSSGDGTALQNCKGARFSYPHISSPMGVGHPLQRRGGYPFWEVVSKSKF